MTLSFSLPGTPKGKGRPRFYNGRAVTPAETRAYEDAIAWAAKAAGAKPLPNPCTVQVVAVFPIPASWPKWKRLEAIAGRVRHTSSPDGDNCLKAALDGCNGICWKDDAQVYDMGVRKVYGQTPELRVSITYDDLPLPSDE